MKFDNFRVRLLGARKGGVIWRYLHIWVSLWRTFCHGVIFLLISCFFGATLIFFLFFFSNCRLGFFFQCFLKTNLGFRVSELFGPTQYTTFSSSFLALVTFSIWLALYITWVGWTLEKEWCGNWTSSLEA